MLRLTIISFLFTLIFIGCNKEKESDRNQSSQRFYYYYDDKIYLNELSNGLTLCFVDSATVKEKVDLISQYSFLIPIDTSQYYLSIYYIVIYFKNIETIQTAKEKISILKNNAKIIQANLLLTTENRSTIGLIDEFIVQPKTETTKQDLDQLVLQTKTKIVERNSFDTTAYILSVDKYSNGDAIDMANWFYETNKFVYSEPNFLILNAFDVKGKVK